MAAPKPNNISCACHQIGLLIPGRANQPLSCPSQPSIAKAENKAPNRKKGRNPRRNRGTILPFAAIQDLVHE